MPNIRIASLVCVVWAATLFGCAAPTTQRVQVTSQQTSAEARRQMDLLAEELLAERVRLHGVHWQLATNSTAMCPKLTRSAGLFTMTVPKGELAASFNRLGISNEPTVVAVVPNSAAEIAGVKPGDIAVSMWGVPASDLAGARERARVARDGEPMPVVVRRNGKDVTLTLQPVLACDYPAVVSDGTEINAYADGERIVVTRGMMAFARSDDELALVVAHEMAHNTMRHMDAKKTNAVAGLVGDLALAVLTRGAYSGTSISGAAAKAYSQEFEAEADYVGLYMLANSGYSIQDAPKFWRRMATANPGSIKGSHTASHPSTAYRMVALEETAKEIDQKKISVATLVPTRKDGRPLVAETATQVAAASPQVGRSAVAAPKAAQGQQSPPLPRSAAAFQGVLRCVPRGTRAGDSVIVDGEEVVVESIAGANTECGANGPTVNLITAKIVPLNPIGAVPVERPAMAPPVRSVEERLRELKKLRAEDLITQEQYESKQRAVLSEQ